MTIKHVTVQQAHQQQEQAAPSTSTCARSPSSSRGIPPGAFNVPLLHLDPATGQMRPNPEFLPVVQANFPPDTPLVIGCKMGGRSQQACEMLVERRLPGRRPTCSAASAARRRWGTPGWVQAGLPVETAADPAHEYDALQKKAAGDR